jgi:2-phosphoglycerate kinase
VNATTSAVINDNSIEGSLARAAGKIMEKVSPNSTMAIVYVTAPDPEIAEFIASELEFIMVEQGLTLIDRSQLDTIRQEQNFQLSDEVDDRQAVSIGKIAGANVILTGAVTGTGQIRRLRLRALDTQSARVLAATSERY